MNLNNKLEQAFDEYETYKERGVHGGSFEILGEIRNVLDSYFFENRDKYYWLGVIEKELELFSDFSLVKDYLKEKLDLIDHVSSIGTVFNEDEFLLLLTASIEAEMISYLLADIGVEYPSVDDKNLEIEEIAKANEKEFKGAVTLIRRNSLLPVISYWITDYS